MPGCSNCTPSASPPPPTSTSSMPSTSIPSPDIEALVREGLKEIARMQKFPVRGRERKR